MPVFLAQMLRVSVFHPVGSGGERIPCVIPAKTGIQITSAVATLWIPALAGMTIKGIKHWRSRTLFGKTPT
jgi:hypothetical protein